MYNRTVIKILELMDRTHLIKVMGMHHPVFSKTKTQVWTKAVLMTKIQTPRLSIFKLM